MRHCLGLLAACAIWLAATAGLPAQTNGSAGGQGASAAQAETSAEKDPALKLRPPPRPGLVKDPPGRIRLDVTVTDAAGKPVGGLGEQDLQLLDNGLPQKLLSFQAVNEAEGGAGTRVSILLVIDTVNPAAADVSYLRDDAEQFLRQNGGHLAQPVTVLMLTETAYHVLGRNSTDGNMLAQVVHDFKASLPTVHSVSGGLAALGQRQQTSFRAISMIADQETEEPGRKMLIWMGPGWPILPENANQYDEHVHARNFDALARLSNHLRHARMEVCSAGGGDEHHLNEFLKPVKSASDATLDRLTLQAIAVHSGGQTLGVGKNPHTVALMHGCMQQIGAYYSLVFDAPASAKVFTYHALKVTVNKPGLTAHANAGYYSEP